MKYLVVVMLSVSFFKAYGQFTKGDKALGGTFSLNMRSYPENQGGIIKDNLFDITPSFGVLLSENLEVGGEIGWSSAYIKLESGSNFLESRSNSFLASLYVQKYFEISEKFLFSVNSGIGFQPVKLKNKVVDTNGNTLSESEADQSIFVLRINPNFIFFPSANWAIRAGLGNISYRHSKQDDTSENNFNVNYGSISLGVIYYFRKGG
jgi:hypothetical protein